MAYTSKQQSRPLPPPFGEPAGRKLAPLNPPASRPSPPLFEEPDKRPSPFRGPAPPPFGDPQPSPPFVDPTCQPPVPAFGGSVRRPSPPSFGEPAFGGPPRFPPLGDLVRRPFPPSFGEPAFGGPPRFPPLGDPVRRPFPPSFGEPAFGYHPSPVPYRHPTAQPPSFGDPASQLTSPPSGHRRSLPPCGVPNCHPYCPGHHSLDRSSGQDSQGGPATWPLGSPSFSKMRPPRHRPSSVQTGMPAASATLYQLEAQLGAESPPTTPQIGHRVSGRIRRFLGRLMISITLKPRQFMAHKWRNFSFVN